MVELRERLERAHTDLLALAHDDELMDAGSPPNAKRLRAKADGVSLALSYLRDFQLLVDSQSAAT